MSDDNSSPTLKSSNVVFFLGAGASVKAGVPTTFSFVDAYINSIKDPSEKKTITKIVSTLKKWKKSKIDIELLLETMTKLQDRDEEPLLSFYRDGIFILGGAYEKEPLINGLKDFIKSKAIVEYEDNVQYLEPFLELIEESRPLDIISANYDTSIEQFCNFYRLTYQDGFDVNWNSATFQRENTDIRLYKIHGSVMWYQSDRGGYIKLPVMTRESKLQLISGEKAENLMLYPMKKWDFVEPLLELLIEMKHKIESESCKFLIVVGYSFRDDHITRILIDAAKKNRDLLVILIDPNAYQIYSTKLKYYDNSKKIPSSLDGRVICLPYFFESVFPHIKNHYLLKIKLGLGIEKSQRRIEIQGQKANWVDCLQYYADAEFTEQCETLLKREPLDDEKYWAIKLEIFLKMAVNLFACGQEKKARVYFKEFQRNLKKVMSDKISITFKDAVELPNYYQIDFKFNYSSYFEKKQTLPKVNSIEPDKMKIELEPLTTFCQIRAGFIKEPSSNLKKIFTTVTKINDYLDSLQNGKISIQDYLAMRRDIISSDKSEKLFEQFEASKKTGNTYKQLRELNEFLTNVEKGVLHNIIDNEHIL
jgi:hypothetical protein